MESKQCGCSVGTHTQQKLGLGQDQRADAAGASGPAWIQQLLCICGTSNGAQQPCMEGISFSFFKSL